MLRSIHSPGGTQDGARVLRRVEPRQRLGGLDLPARACLAVVLAVKLGPEPDLAHVERETGAVRAGPA